MKILSFNITQCRCYLALALNLLKGIFERSRIPFNKFRASAKNIKNRQGYLSDFCYKKNKTGWGIIYCFGLIGSCITFYTHPFAYDAAIYAAQKGDIKSADQQLRTMVTNSPENAQVLYDAGVVAHALNKTQQAAAYFSRAAEYADDDKDLQFQAHFNAGNTSVAHKDLKSGLAHYDKALIIKPDNEYAKHNRDRVAQMLKEQEKKDQQKNKNDTQQKEKNDENNDQQDQQKKDNESGNDGNEEQQNNGNDQQDGKDQQQKQNNNSSDDGLNEKSQSEQGKDSTQDSKREEGKEQGNKEKRDQNSADDEKRDGQQGLDKESDHTKDKGKKQQRKQHKKAPEKQNVREDDTSLSSDDKQEQEKNKVEQGSGKALQNKNKEEAAQCSYQKFSLVHVPDRVNNFQICCFLPELMAANKLKGNKSPIFTLLA